MQHLVALALPTVDEFLSEEPLAVQQADGAERQPEVAGGLEVVAGEDAEPTRVLRHHLADAELGGVVDDVRRCGRRTAEMVAQLAGCVGEIGAEHLVVAQRQHIPRRQGTDRFERVTSRPGGRECVEHGGGAMVPGPAQVAGEVDEGRPELFGGHGLSGGVRVGSAQPYRAGGRRVTGVPTGRSGPPTRVGRSP